MASTRRRLPHTSRLTMLFAAVLVPPAVALVWLGAALFEQDRRLAAERFDERRDAAGGVIVRALVQSLAGVDTWLSSNELPPGAVRLTLSGNGVDAVPLKRLAWHPAPPPRPEADSDRLRAAERAEFARTGDMGLADYSAAAENRDPRVRAGALVRLARVLRKQGRTDEALRAYSALARITSIDLNRTPVDLIARRMIGELLVEMGRRELLAAHAGELQADLERGRWLLDRAAWELAAADVQSWTGHPVAAPNRIALSRAADWVRAAQAELGPSGRRTVTIGDNLSVITWTTSGNRRVVALVPQTTIAGWLDAATARDLPAEVSAALVDDTGRLIAGTRPRAGSRSSTLPVTESGLPWTLLVTPLTDMPTDPALDRRRVMYTAALAMLALLLAGGSYVLWRVVHRELAVARLQTDFVAAVSHEFRTPLTSLRHITELLQESDDLPEVRRRSFYDVLAQSTERLHRLVESVLDVARTEEGRRPYDQRPTDAAALVREVAAAFSREHTTLALDVDVPHRPIPIMLDADAIARALWNLLDNAVKYSPEGAAVRVEMRASGSRVAIAVIDQGMGIPAAEHEEIFRRFVRGRAATARRIPGTGLGLAMVAHIVSAHGGKVAVQSADGRGSTFTIELPAMRAGVAVDERDTPNVGAEIGSTPHP